MMETVKYQFITISRKPIKFEVLGILRDYTPEFICCIVLSFPSFPIYSIKQGIKLSTIYEFIKYRNYTTFDNGSETRLASYVAGLIAGDGTIHVPKTERSNKGNYNYPSIQIVFHLKDLPLALLIQKEIGHGTIRRKKGVNATVRYREKTIRVHKLQNILENKLFPHSLTVFIGPFYRYKLQTVCILLY